MPRYVLNQPVVLGVTFTVTGVVTDPTTVSLTVTDPAGTAVTYTYAGATITKTSTGVYTKTFTATTIAGVYSYVWTGTGTAADVQDGTFTVYPVVPLASLYCTLDDAKSWLQIGATDTTEDAILQTDIAAVSRHLDYHCRGANNSFYQQTNTRTFVANGRYLLDIDDLATTTGLVVKTDASGDGVFETTWSASDYQTLPLNAAYGADAEPWTQLRAVGSNSFPLPYTAILARRDRVQITGTWGWPSLPEPIHQACIILVARVFKRRYSPEGAAGFNEMGVVNIKPQDWDAVRFISPYIRGDEVVAFA